MKRSKADAMGNGVFLVFLGVLFYFNWWWPGMLVAIWASLATRQLVTGRTQDFLVTSILLLSLFLVAFFNLSWHLFMPILFVLAGGYIIFREFLSDKEN